ncbi:MAG: single-stranded-DNA-specific exonuclease RecJ [Truepera sp.]|nr:single-stranded-DNA-specific exonuclease RecJ [Truepera sp.]
MPQGVPEVRWSVRPPAPPSAVAALSRALQVPPALAAVLWARGLRDEARSHLDPPLVLSPNPALAQAAERLALAVRQGKRILIHGDYDADGISGTAVLFLGLQELGANVATFIPDRLTDGYGVHMARVPEHAARADLFITVDCGVTNLAEIGALQEAGVEVIVTDHHSPGAALPDCLVVHPGLSPAARHGLPELTGAGVAFHLLWALHDALGLEAPLEYADLATLGTIADVAPLLGENRALIREGLKRLHDSRWPGLRASVAQARLSAPISARSVAFVLAPRLNAAGRLGEADVGLELLVTRSERRAAELAVYLDARNLERRKIQDGMYESALAKADPEAPALVIEDPSWHPGVMGIVASKLLERFYLPVYIAAAGKGSVRSTPGISAVEGLRAAAPHLLRFGGHKQAAGFALDMENFGAFRAAVHEFAGRFPRPVPTVVADTVIGADEVTAGLYRAIVDLEPFGEGHPAPLFALTGTLDAARAVGKDGNTLQLRIGGVKGVAWRMGELAPGLPVGGSVNVAVELEENEFRNARTLEFRASAVRAAEPLRLAPEVGEDTAAPLVAAPVTRAGTGRLVTDLGPDAVATLEGLVRAGTPVVLALGPDTLHELEREAKELPTVSEVRRGLQALRRGAPSPYLAAKSERILQALRELGTVDELGRAVRLPAGTRLSPYESPGLMAGLLRRYQLRTFVHAYRHLDDEGLAITTARLFGEAVAVATGDARAEPLEEGVPHAIY